MARSIFSECPPADSGEPFGIGKAIRSCLTDTRYILYGRCDLVDYVLRDFADFEAVPFTLSVVRSLLRTVVYLLESFAGLT